MADTVFLIVLGAFLTAGVLPRIIDAMRGRNSIDILPPSDDAPPEVWTAYYEAVAKIAGDDG